jgi:hypothetical protein
MDLAPRLSRSAARTCYRAFGSITSAFPLTSPQSASARIIVLPQIGPYLSSGKPQRVTLQPSMQCANENSSKLRRCAKNIYAVTKGCPLCGVEMRYPISLAVAGALCLPLLVSSASAGSCGITDPGTMCNYDCAGMAFDGVDVQATMTANNPFAAVEVSAYCNGGMAAGCNGTGSCTSPHGYGSNGGGNCVSNSPGGGYTAGCTASPHPSGGDCDPLDPIHGCIDPNQLNGAFIIVAPDNSVQGLVCHNEACVTVIPLCVRHATGMACGIGAGLTVDSLLLYANVTP